MVWSEGELMTGLNVWVTVPPIPSRSWVKQRVRSQGLIVVLRETIIPCRESIWILASIFDYDWH